MRKFILIAGFVWRPPPRRLGDRSLSLGGGETATVTAPAKATEGSRIVEAPPAAEAPKYIERPAVVEPKAETSKLKRSGLKRPRLRRPRLRRPRPQRTGRRRPRLIGRTPRPQGPPRGRWRQCQEWRSRNSRATGPKPASFAGCIGTASTGNSAPLIKSTASCPALCPPSLKLRRANTGKPRRSLGGEGCRASTF